MGLPIPSGFVLTTTACIAYQADKQWPAGLREQVDASVRKLEKISGKTFGAIENPLLVSVRSGARISMPGMMDTVLNLGLNPEVVATLAKNTGNPRFAYDSFRRFIQMFGDVVCGLQRMKFEHILESIKVKKGVKLDTDLTADDLKLACDKFLVLFEKLAGKPFPCNAQQQLDDSINAVFDSWNNDRAITYRNINKIPHDFGTAVNVQEMVYGNMGDDSATGVAFTRNPSTGENARYGEYLPNAQGEDVVAGIRTPIPIDQMKLMFPHCAKQLYDIFEQLEEHYKDMQDIEFTIEKKKLFILQTRNGKRTAPAAVRMAVDMVKEGMIGTKEAVCRVQPRDLEKLLHKQLDPKALKSAKKLVKGLPASPGAAVGQVVFNSDTAVEWAEQGKKVVLVRLETSPEDIQGMAISQGVLTARGGMTSHAAVVARGMNICCVAGCSDITVNEEEKWFKTYKGKVFREGDVISLDGSEGVVYAGALPVVDPQLQGEFEILLKYADTFRTMEIRANADTAHDAKIAKSFGARGIGLCRTEHMFFSPARILAVREMILANDKDGRAKALAKLLPYQRQDFRGILEAMDGLPVVIRLLDPPLHEFLPHEPKEVEELSKASGLTVEYINSKVESMKEFNPMLGFRGCRLGVVNPEINEMQVRAIFEAALSLVKDGADPRPAIEVPLVGNLKEYMPIKAMIKKLAVETGAEGVVNYEVGTMIEVPRAALTANLLADEADFMSFGTNDLTQMTCGFSRDDAGAFLGSYVKRGIYSADPFQAIDQEGVGKLMKLCVSLSRGVNPNIDIGICGEHGGEPSSVEFCHRIGLNNVSCSPFRVPIARLAAAHAAIKYGTTPAGESVFLKAKL